MLDPTVEPGSDLDYLLNLLLTGESSLCVELADAGYDVWLGNNRGNKHSRGHKSLQQDSVAFWRKLFIRHILPCF